VNCIDFVKNALTHGINFRTTYYPPIIGKRKQFDLRPLNYYLEGRLMRPCYEEETVYLKISNLLKIMHFVSRFSTYNY